MSDPGRLFDETDDELERLLIGAGRSEKSSPQARARTLAALGLTGSAALAATATAASVSILGKMTWAKVVLGLTALGTIAVLPPVYRAWHRHHGGVATTRTTAPASSPTTAPAPTAGAGSAGLGEGKATRDTLALTRELGAVDAIRAALARGEARSALRALDAYARAYPRGGRLALEAEILRIDALDRVGRRDEARSRATAFLDGHANSVLAARARRYLRD